MIDARKKKFYIEKVRDTNSPLMIRFFARKLLTFANGLPHENEKI